MEQPGILDGDGCLQRKSGQKFELGVVEGESAHSPHGHRAPDRRTRHQGRHHQTFVRLLNSAGDLDSAWIRPHVVDVFRVTGFQQAADDARPRHDLGRLDGVGDFADGDDGAVGLAGGVGQEDRAVIGVEEILGMPGDAVHHRRQVERRGDVAPYFGQRGGFARAALRLVEQPRVFERHAHGASNRLQQPYVGSAECVFAVHVKQLD